MAALVKFSRPGCTTVPQVLGVAFVSKRGKSNEVTMQNYKRGTGGRSSFSGIVATVFGSTGFVGRYVVNRLGKMGSQIIVPYRCDEYDLNHLKVMGDLGQILYQPFHLQDDESIRKSIQYSNVVINLIGRDRETKNFTFDDVHVAGAARIARLAKEAGVKDFIHLSSMNAANPQEFRVFNPETGSRFLTSKYDGEQAVKEHFPEATILRPGSVVGDEDRFIRNYVKNSYRRRQNITLWEKGHKTLKRPIRVTDVSQAIVNCIDNPDAKGKTFELVGNEVYTLHDLVMFIFNVVSYNSPPTIHNVSKLFLLETMLRERFYLLSPYRLDTLDRDHVSDMLTPGCGTIEDLGVTTEPVLDYIEWLVKPYSEQRYYWDLQYVPPVVKPDTFTPKITF